jgi:sec-independent protein translocase protein TatB
MMPGIGFAETILLVLVAVVVIGPKDLPLMMRKFGRFTGKMRALAFEFKQGFDELGRQAELEELRKEVEDLKKHTGMEDIQREFEQDRINMEKDVDSALAPVALPAAPPAHPAAAANGAAPAPEMPKHAGLSADHPGYDTGEDFRIEGHGPLPAPEANGAADPHPEPALGADPKDTKPEPQPVKQDTPA